MSNKFLIALFLFCCLITGLEFYLFSASFSYLNKSIFHLLIVVFIGLYTLCHRNILEKPFLILLALCVTVLGPFGSILCSIGILIYSLPFATETSDELFSLLLPSIKEEDSKILYDRLLYGFEIHQSSIAPTSFNEIMSYGSFYQKKTVIEKIIRFFTPSFTPILRRALKDSNAVIRTLAATAIVAIDDRFFQKYSILEAQAKKIPTAVNILLFAKFCEIYFYSDVTDEERKQHVGEKVIFAFEKYQSIKPDDPTIFLSLAKLYYQFQKKEKSLHLLKKYIEKFPKNYEANQWYMRILYENKEYAAVRQQSLKDIWKNGISI